MLNLIGCAMVSTATRHRAHSLPVQPTNQRMQMLSARNVDSHTDMRGISHSETEVVSHTHQSVPGGDSPYMWLHLRFQIELIYMKPAWPHIAVCSLGASRFKGDL